MISIKILQKLWAKRTKNINIYYIIIVSIILCMIYTTGILFFYNFLIKEKEYITDTYAIDRITFLEIPENKNIFQVLIIAADGSMSSSIFITRDNLLKIKEKLVYIK